MPNALIMFVIIKRILRCMQSVVTWLLVNKDNIGGRILRTSLSEKYFCVSVPRLPTIETIENCMKLSPMIVQGLWEYKSPLLQLPYITEDHLKYFTNRKKHIKSLLQLAQLPGEDRRQVLRFLDDKQYDDLMKVLGNMPYIHFQVNTEGMFSNI